MSGCDSRWSDPRDRENDAREIEIQWVDLERGDDADPHTEDARENSRERGGGVHDRDPRDPLLDGLELPRGADRELVIDGDHRYELNGEDSRSLAAIGAFRVVSENDLRQSSDTTDEREPDFRHLRDEGLVRFVEVEGHPRLATLTERGRHLLQAHRRDHDDHCQAFYAGVSRTRELSHDVQVYRAYRREAARLHDEGADIRRIVLEQDLKREYQEWLQEPNRDRPDSDGRPDRDPHEIEQWAREHDLPYFDDRVRFPDLRIEYELDGRHRHEDVEVMTEHYRGAHRASVARAGFTCYGSRGGGGGRPFDPRVAEDFV